MGLTRLFTTEARRHGENQKGDFTAEIAESDENRHCFFGLLCVSVTPW